MLNILDDNTPQSAAAGTIYFVVSMCHLNINKLKIKELCIVSEVTINKCYKKLHRYKDSLIPPCIVEKYK